LSAEQQIVRTQIIDESSLKKVAGMGFPQEQILQALSMGSELLTSRKMAQHVNLRQMAVLYNLILDQKRRKEQDLNNATLAIEDKMKVDENLSAARHDILAPKLYTLCADGGRWYLGREYGNTPQQIFTELYKALKSLNFEWKTVSPYKCKARYPMGLLDRQGRRVPASEVVKVTIHCYKTPRSMYILDFQKTYGQTFLFLDLCGRLLAGGLKGLKLADPATVLETKTS
jgi:hypothetical protein